MGLFDQIVGAIDDPNLQASAAQLSNILSTTQQVADSQGVSSDATQTALSVLGGYVRSALQSKRANQGGELVQAFVNQHSGTTADASAVSSLFSPQQQAQVAQAISSRIGLNASTIQNMLPMLVPLVLNLLQTGTNTRNPQQGNNPVLNNFLDADGDGDVDVADAMRMAGRFLNQ